ncbi:MAG: hypothetical protein FWF15_11385 [Oscillospiraceae bacterium]|nr:hypothetical protein [Oscillospiraceae bacterium]
MGSTNYQWQYGYIKNLTIDTKVTFGGSSYYSYTDQYGSLIPHSSTSYYTTLGSSSYYWASVYIGSTSARIGNSQSSLIGFYGIAPVNQTTLANISSSATNTDIINKLNEIMAVIRRVGLART